MSETTTKPDDLGLKFDDKRRLIPLSPEQHKARAEAIRKMFDEWDDRPDDDPPGVDEAIVRAFEAGRPLFDGTD